MKDSSEASPSPMCWWANAAGQVSLVNPWLFRSHIAADMTQLLAGGPDGSIMNGAVRVYGSDSYVFATRKATSRYREPGIICMQRFPEHWRKLVYFVDHSTERQSV